MVEKHKIPLAFYRLASGREPVREFLKAFPFLIGKLLETIF